MFLPHLERGMYIFTKGFYYRSLSHMHTFACTYDCLLPVRPPSLTYLGLGVMLEPYARHVVYASGA